MLSDVRSPWDLRKPEWLDKHGTILRLSGLRATWNERMFRRLSTRLSRLVSPFDAIGDFQIHIESDEFPDYAGPVTGGYLDVAPYSLEATFDGGETVSVRLDRGKAARHPWTGSEPLVCGSVRVRLYAFDLETEALAKMGPRVDVRAWLREWSGVSVYRDGFRVWPYGEPHDDWLRLDQRRVNNPVVKLSNNQVVGFVEIAWRPEPRAAGPDEPGGPDSQRCLREPAAPHSLRDAAARGRAPVVAAPARQEAGPPAGTNGNRRRAQRHSGSSGAPIGEGRW